MGLIKAIGLDYFGTVACHHDGEDICPFRNGLKRFFDECDRREIKINITSDKPIGEIQKSIERYAKNNPIHNGWIKDLRIWNYYHLWQSHKDFRELIVGEGIKAEELFVIGDDLEKDIGGAIDSGANYQLVQPYDSLAEHDNLGWGMTSFEQIIQRNASLFSL